MLYIAVGLLGLCIGSFFNVLISRWERGESVVWGRSHCPFCKVPLIWYDLIPVVSFFVLRRKCRSCRKPISWQYPLVELITSVFLITFAYQYGLTFSPQVIWLGLLMVGFSALLFFDWVHFVLPDSIILGMGVLTVGYIAGWEEARIFSSLITGLLTCALFAILYVVSRGRWVGFGDVKLVFLIGVSFGYPFGALVVISSIWVAALVGILLMVTGKATAKSAIPFGSFLAGVSIFYIIFFNEIQTFRWYF